MVQVKICGLKTPDAVEAAIQYGADYIGLVHFAKSPRHVSLAEAAELAQIARGRIKSVLLLVNPDTALIDEATKAVSPDFIQLHGHETINDVAAIRLRANRPVIKAVAVATRADVAAAAAYADVADLLLFDAKPPKGADLPGGNGVAFDWSSLSGFNTDAGLYVVRGSGPANRRRGDQENRCTNGRCVIGGRELSRCQGSRKDQAVYRAGPHKGK